MRTALDQLDRLTVDSGQSMVCFHVLSFFNKRKLWVGKIREMEESAGTLIPRLSKVMIEHGLSTENINSLANALFFYVRSIETQNRAETPAEVASYSSVMRFVARLSPARRVQAILTEGSFHRHYCSQDRLPWQEFKTHADEAINLFERSLLSSRPAGMITLSANALVYCGELIVKSLRFTRHVALDQNANGTPSPPIASSESLVDQDKWLRAQLADKFAAVDSFLTAVGAQKDSLKGDLNLQLICSLTRYRALYVLLLASFGDAVAGSSVKEKLDDAIRVVGEFVDSLDRDGRPKHLQLVLTDVQRVVSYCCMQPNGNRPIKACSSSLINLLDRAARILPKHPKALRDSKIRKQGAKIVGILNAEGVQMPAPLAAVYNAPLALRA